MQSPSVIPLVDDPIDFFFVLIIFPFFIVDPIDLALHPIGMIVLLAIDFRCRNDFLQARLDPGEFWKFRLLMLRLFGFFLRNGCFERIHRLTIMNETGCLYGITLTASFQYA